MTNTKWLTVDEASLRSQELGLNRTKKTIRNWARNGHVAAHKQTTSHGEMWVLDKDELTAKIKAELEFAEQSRTRSETSEPVQTRADHSEPVRTSANPFEPVRTEPESALPGTDETQSRDMIRSLQSQIQALTIDVKWRDHMLDKQSRENEALLENLHGQARYIGHLESDLLRLGGEPDQQFLAAPKAPSPDAHVDDSPAPSLRPDIIAHDRPHPDQQSFASG